MMMEKKKIDDNTLKYYCPMRCEGDKVYDEPGSCPVCGMHLSVVQSKEDNVSEDSKVNSHIKHNHSSLQDPDMGANLPNCRFAETARVHRGGSLVWPHPWRHDRHARARTQLRIILLFCRRRGRWRQSICATDRISSPLSAPGSDGQYQYAFRQSRQRTFPPRNGGARMDEAGENQLGNLTYHRRERTNGSFPCREHLHETGRRIPNASRRRCD